MGDNLVIVESPAKAKTIEKFLGKDYLVKSSFGHIRDLPKKGIGVDVDNDFEPTYEVSSDKQKVVSELKKLASQAKCVWLASDEDREGEAIAWHLSQVLGLDVNNTKRIVFHEITENAIKNAIKNPRTVDINLVNAQQARRILDRLVGFELSPVLWRKIRPSLSAGRVQSVAVKLVVEREREIIDFKSKAYFKVVADFIFTDSKGKSHNIKADLNSRFNNEEDASSFLDICAESVFKVEDIEKKPAKRTPAAPFTTSTLQQEASRKLGFSVSRTMSVAQRLYEAGLITYMRTDSVNLSVDAVKAINEVILSSYGDQYLKNRVYKTKAKGAQEAHEAIRPSYINQSSIEATPQEKRLYNLIWKRTVASQMADAALERTNIDISVSGSDKVFVAKGEVVKFDGFLKLYSESVDNNDTDDDDDDSLLPAVAIGTILSADSVIATQRFDQRPARYSEASLVKQMEELGIGRPSTYAPTITTIINRGYIVKEDRDGVKREFSQLTLVAGKTTKEIKSEITGSEKSKLFPTDIGMIVNDYLQNHFPDILDYNFTAHVEKQFDDIAEGDISWGDMIRGFYNPFHNTVSNAADETRGYASSGQRLLGVDPASNKNIYARMGRFGAMVQLGETGEDEKPLYAGLTSGMLIETISLEEALQLFRLPRTLGDYEQKSVVVGTGRFGPYIRHNSKFVSLEKEDNPYTIILDRAIELIEQKRKKERDSLLRVFDNDDKLQVIDGRWGAYIAFDGNNYKLPKGSDYKAMSYDDFMDIINKTKSEEGGKSAAKSKTKQTRKPKKK